MQARSQKLSNKTIANVSEKEALAQLGLTISGQTRFHV
ncbi:hypothetical protein B0G85_1172 [Polynucleobacter brandtiae]|uniref:Uncharacterized protein n=1 Tax=Polynucleobacter brandtiae TaxID=1938816 RepID=A0A2M8VRT5_9BURK|nr:hypothetical protein B0G85_1172 [Polynucleobacter brandtiae]